MMIEHWKFCVKALKQSAAYGQRQLIHTMLFIGIFSSTQGLSEPTYLPGDRPLQENIEKLRPFFSPKLGDLVEVDSRELRDFDHQKAKINHLNLRGFIHIKPPKNHCFTITRNLDEPDDIVCKPKQLSFTLQDLQKDGSIRWTIKTGPLDFGTEVRWKSPYRLASLMPSGKDEDTVVHRLIHSCQAQKNPHLGRIIILRYFGGEQWLIDFPEEEKMLPQPPPVPNLYIAVPAKKGLQFKKIKTSSKGSSTETGTTPSTSTGEPTAGEPAEQATGTATATATGTATGTATQVGSPDSDPVEDEFEDREAWAIARRNAYKMEGYRLMPYGTTTKWFKGECRYTYLGPSEDPDTGRLECHDVDGFKEVYLPLTCMGEIKRL